MRFRSRKGLLFQVLLDAGLIVFSVCLAWVVRYELELTPAPGEGFFYQPLNAYFPLIVVLTPLTIIIFRFEGLYPLARGQNLLDEFYIIINGTTTAALLLMAFTFFVRPLVYSRAVYVYTAIAMVVLLCLARWIERIIFARLRPRGIGVDRVLIVGAGEVGRTMMRNIVAQPHLAYHIVGFVDDDPERGRTDIGRFKALGDTNNLKHLIKEWSVNEVIVTLPWTARDKIIGIMRMCQRINIPAKIVPDLFQLSLSRVAIDAVGGIPLIGIRETGMGLIDTWFKRGIDLVGGGLVLLIALPLMSVFALLIRFDSPGPMIFRQKRVGRGGKEFIAYKFRTMYVGAEEAQHKFADLNEASGPLFKIRNDPRRTRVGAWLRRTSMDELPQIVNVLRGEMSLVGPRPPMPSEVIAYQDWHKRRLEVSPGMTGLWQVSGRSELLFDEMVMLDIYYIENWSPIMDVWILLRTIPTVLFGRGAY